jgi:hypothetical protein
MSPIHALHGQEEVLLAPLREDARLETTLRADEHRAHVRSELPERIRDSEGRVQVPTRPAA